MELERFIALTGVNQASIDDATEHLARGITERDVHAAVLQGVKSAHEAAAVYANHGELWCIGADPASDELVALVDRTIDDSTPERLASGIRKALDEYLGKTQVAA